MEKRNKNSEQKSSNRRTVSLNRLENRIKTTDRSRLRNGQRTRENTRKM